MEATPTLQTLRACHCCGLIQTLPTDIPPHTRPICHRCHTPLRYGTHDRNRWTLTLSLTALAFYLPAMLLPMLHVQRLGYAHADSLLNGVIAMLAEGQWLVGTVVLLFSVLLPPVKLVVLVWLCVPQWHQAHQHRALLYHLVELLGRWGMLDIMLVAVLLAFIKLGDMLTIHAGMGLIAFAVMVLLSLLASMWFNPASLWLETEEEDDEHAHTKS